jgi:hypothetical protein
MMCYISHQERFGSPRSRISQGFRVTRCALGNIPNLRQSRWYPSISATRGILSQGFGRFCDHPIYSNAAICLGEMLRPVFRVPFESYAKNNTG